MLHHCSSRSGLIGCQPQQMFIQLKSIQAMDNQASITEVNLSKNGVRMLIFLSGQKFSPRNNSA